MDSSHFLSKYIEINYAVERHPSATILALIEREGIGGIREIVGGKLWEENINKIHRISHYNV